MGHEGWCGGVGHRSIGVAWREVGGHGADLPGGRLQYTNARMCVLGSENVPILKDTLGKKKKSILNGSSAYFIPILVCNCTV